MKNIKGFIIDEIEKEMRLFKMGMTKNKRALEDPYPIYFTIQQDKEFKANTIEEVVSKIKPDSYCTLFAHLKCGKKIEIPKKYWVNILKRNKNEIFND
jgi:hypothetical protein